MTLATETTPPLFRNDLRALAAGPLLAILSYWLLPDSYIDADGNPVLLAPATKATVAVAVWMAVWWFTEAVDISVTALLPLVLFPLAGIADIKTTASSYASDLIFLFVGGFILGMSIQRWHLDRRIALLVLLAAGERPANVVAGFMLVAAFLSGFISNTATTVMLLPIAMSVLSLQQNAAAASSPRENNFSVCLMIAIAYAASLGGISTIIGTLPNAFAAGFIRDSLAEEFSVDISFVAWMKMALPVSLTLLVCCWFLLTRLVFPLGRQLPGIHREHLKAQYRNLGAMSRGEWISLGVFALAVVLWVSRPFVNKFSVEISGIVHTPFSGLSDAGIAILAALLLFVLPVEKRCAAMDWKTAVKLPWGILILLGGGLALASAIKRNEVDRLLGHQIEGMAHLPDFALLLLIVTLVVFLTEFTSNTATTTVLIPLLAAFAVPLDIDPLLLLLPASFAASCAFMMPIATPPNAIVFSSGHIRISQMVRSGIWMNLLAAGLVTSICYFWLPQTSIIARS